MRLNDFCEGLAIFRDHFDVQNGFHIGAEHDQFFVYPTDKPLNILNYERLLQLGWYQPDSSPKFGYDPKAGWSCWV